MKRSVFVFITLNITIAILAAIILLPEKSGAEAHMPVTAEVYERYRDASAGVAEEIVRETRLMGYGDDSVERVFFSDGRIYIFGNASLKGLDFDSYGGFLCVLSGNGRILRFTYFEGRLTAAGIAEGGFAAATLVDAGEDSERAIIYAVDIDGEAIEVCYAEDRVICLYMSDGGRVAAVTAPDPNSVRLIEYTVSGGAWQKGRSTLISGGYDLSLLGCYYMNGEYILAMRASRLPRFDSLVFYTFAPGGDGIAHWYDGTGICTPYAVLPYGRGFLAACRREDSAIAVSVDYTFTSYRRDTLGFPCEGGRLLYDGSEYYMCFDRSGGAITYAFDSNLSRRELDFGGSLLAGAYGSGVFSRTLGNRLEVGGVKLEVNGVTVHGGRLENGIVTAVISASGGSALSPTTGGRDIYVIAVRL